MLLSNKPRLAPGPLVLLEILLADRQTVPAVQPQQKAVSQEPGWPVWQPGRRLIHNLIQLILLEGWSLLRPVLWLMRLTNSNWPGRARNATSTLLQHLRPQWRWVHMRDRCYRLRVVLWLKQWSACYTLEVISKVWERSAKCAWWCYIATAWERRQCSYIRKKEKNNLAAIAMGLNARLSTGLQFKQ